MTKLVALAFEGEGTADSMLSVLRELEGRGALVLDDAVVISRPAHSERLVMHRADIAWSGTGGMPMGAPGAAPVMVPANEVNIDQTTYRRGRAAAKGAGIGFLAGWLLGGPVGGLAIGALLGGMRDRGIDDKFANEIANAIHSDSSALLLLVERADADVVLAEIRPFKGRVLQTELSPEAERSLNEALAREE